MNHDIEIQQEAEAMLGSFIAGKDSLRVASFTITFEGEDYQVYFALEGTTWQYKGAQSLSE